MSEEELPIKLTEEEQVQMEDSFKNMVEVLLNPPKSENVKIRMKLSKSGLLHHLETIKLLRPDVVDLQMGDEDSLTVSYDFTIAYLGNVAKALQAVQTLCEAPDVVMEASCEELEQGRILVYEVLKRLEAIIALKKG